MRAIRRFSGLMKSQAAAWTLGAVGLLVASIALVTLHWERISGGEAPLGSDIGGVTVSVATAMAIYLAIWRGVVATRQASTAQMGLLFQRYQQAADMLGNDTLSVRLGGIYALTQLAEEHSNEFEVPVMRLLCAFLRNPIDPESIRDTEGWEGLPLRIPLRQDFEEALQAVLERARDSASIGQGREYQPDLREADLSHASMAGAELGGADISGANLECADLTRASLADARLIRARLGRSVLVGAKLPDADMTGALLPGANLSGSDLTRTRLIVANLSGATLFGTDLHRAILMGAVVSGTLFGQRNVSPVVEGSVSTSAAKGLTQAQLDSARADPGNPPQLAWGMEDAETGRPLEWRGGSPAAEPPDP